MRALVTNTPLKAPAAKPQIKQQKKASTMFPVPTNKAENTKPENAITSGKERSISPAIITQVKPKLIIAYKGRVDMRE
jgi:hypothetical protein